MAVSAREYLIGERGIDPAIADYAAWREEGNLYVIPYFDALGRERAHRFHNPRGKPKYMTPNKEKIHLYCVENARFGKVILCEGEIDTLSAISAGYHAVGVAGANSFHRSWVHLLDHCEDLTIAFDGDRAGKEAAAKIKSVLPFARIVEPPEGKDLNDLLRDYGPEAITRLVEGE